MRVDQVLKVSTSSACCMFNWFGGRIPRTLRKQTDGRKVNEKGHQAWHISYDLLICSKEMRWFESLNRFVGQPQCGRPKKFSFSSSSISYIGFFLASFVHSAERPTMNREKKKQLYEFSVHQCSGAKEANENSRAIMKKP